MGGLGRNLTSCQGRVFLWHIVRAVEGIINVLAHCESFLLRHQCSLRVCRSCQLSAHVSAGQDRRVLFD